MQYRNLGQQGLTVSAIGYGAMVLEGFYGGVDEAQAVRTLQHALDRGITHIDTADAYGNGHNEMLVGRAIEGRRRADIVVTTKFGIVFDGTPATELPTGWGFSLQVNGRADYVRKSLDRSLKALNTDYIDVWYAHYADPRTPIEETVTAMAEGVKAGKVKYLGLSNVTADEVRRAHAVHPISAVQYEYSLSRREAELSLLPTLNELGIGLVAWSPLGNGFLTGAVGAVASGDFRNTIPLFHQDNLAANRERFEPVRTMASELGITPAQLALAWLLHKGDAIAPIPGTRTPSRVDENAAAASVMLTPAQIVHIDALAPVGHAIGGALVTASV
jgi:aryl-alcohol dehydrogenase-like predicted oxidoreductase